MNRLARTLFTVTVLWLLPVESEARQSDRFCTPNPGNARSMALRRSDTKFTVGGTPTFLTMFALFGANHYTPESIGPLFDQLCSKGFNGVRIFAEFWDNQPNCGGGVFPYATPSKTIIQAGGGLPITPQLINLAGILIRARTAGLVVDLSFGYEVVQGRTVADLAAGLATLAGFMSAEPWNYDHVMIDAQNEHEGVGNHPCMKYPNNRGPMTQAERNALVAAGKTGDPARVVFLSVAGEQNTAQLIGNLNAGGAAVALHEFRHHPEYDDWLDTAYEMVAALIANQIRMPLYMQEPDRWMHPSYYPCTVNGSLVVENPCELTHLEFLENAHTNLAVGTAAWTFHNEYFFWPHRPGIRLWGAPEQGLVDGLKSYLTGRCWGSSNPGWIVGGAQPPSCTP